MRAAAGEMPEIIALVAAGRVRLGELITHTFSLEEFADGLPDVHRAGRRRAEGRGARRDDAPVFCSCAITGGMSVPGQSAAIPVTPEEIVDSAVGRERGRRGDRPRPRARAGDGQADRRPRAVPGGAGRDRRALRRDRAADERRRRRHDDRGARAGRDRVPAGDGDVQLRLVQLRHLQGAPPAGDGAVGDRVPRVHARLHLQEHVRRHAPALRAVPRGGHEARVRGLRRRPRLQPRPPRRGGARRLPASTSSSCSACSGRTPPRSTSSCTCAAPRVELFGARALHVVGGRRRLPGPVPPRRRRADAWAGTCGSGSRTTCACAADRRADSNAELVEKAMALAGMLDREPVGAAARASCSGCGARLGRVGARPASGRVASGACASPRRRARASRASSASSTGRCSRRAGRGRCPARETRDERAQVGLEERPLALERRVARAARDRARGRPRRPGTARARRPPRPRRASRRRARAARRARRRPSARPRAARRALSSAARTGNASSSSSTRELAHRAAAVGLVDDAADVLEVAERLADRGLRDAELLRDPRLDQPRARARTRPPRCAGASRP